MAAELSRWFQMESSEDQQLSTWDQVVVEAIKMVDQDPTGYQDRKTLPKKFQRGHLIDALATVLQGLQWMGEEIRVKEKTVTHWKKKFSVLQSEMTSQAEEQNEKVHTEEEEENEKSEKLTSQAEAEEEKENEKVTKISENSISAENVTKGLLDQNTTQKVVCKFYKAGCCRFKTNCKYNHPKTCEAFENFGYKEGGCRQNNCQSGLHLNVCKFFMRGKCKKEDCKWFHPKRLMQHQSDQKSGNNMMAQALSEISKILSLLMQEHSKTHTGEKAQGSP